MLVVTGTQRSGTSVITKLLKESGYDVGSDFWDEAVQGGYENAAICGFYRDYLGDPDFPFDDMEVEEINGFQFARLDYRIAKFSYLLMNPAFVFIWNKYRPFVLHDDQFLVMDRPKDQVIRSKARVPSRFSHDSVLLKIPTDVLMQNFHKSLLIMARLRAKTHILPFPYCLEDVWMVNEALKRLDPKVQIPREVWYRIVDLRKIHFRPGD